MPVLIALLVFVVAIASARIRSRFSAWVKSVLDKLAPRLGGQGMLHETRDEPHGLPVINESPRRCVREGCTSRLDRLGQTARRIERML
jgi:hypothetical protein